MTTDGIRGCSICGCRKTDVLHTQRFVLPTGTPLPSSYDVVCCPACGFVYADTEATQRTYEYFYTALSKYEDAETGTGGGLAPWDAERLAETAKTVVSLLPSKKRRVLDLGCSNGGLLEALSACGVRELAGVDPSPACVKNTKAKGFQAWRGHLFDVPPDAGKYNCVVLSHVLEHVVDLRDGVAVLEPLLDREAVLYVEVPDASRYADFLYAPFQEFNTEHINHFSHASLSNLMGRNCMAPVLEDRKVLKCSGDCLYPAIYGAYRLAEAAEWRVDTTTRGNIERYIRESRAMMCRINARLQDVLQSSRSVVIWGTGQLAMKLLDETVLKDASIAACVDGNPANRGRQLRGVPIIGPTEIPSPAIPIVITSTLHETAIRNCIRTLGLMNPVVSLRV